MPRIVMVLLIVIVVIGGIHTYLWWRLVAGTTKTRRGRLIGTAILVSLVAVGMLGLRGQSVLPDPVAPVIGRIGPLWVAVMFYLLITLLVLEFVRPIVRLVLRRYERRHASADSVAAPGVAGSVSSGGREPRTPELGSTAGSSAPSTVAVEDPEKAAVDDGGSDRTQGAAGDDSGSDRTWAMDRRVFLSRVLAVTAGATAIGTVGYGIGAARDVRLKRVPMTLAKLDPGMDGFRFAVLTDVHLSETLRRPYLENVVRRVNALDVDAVAVVGDLVDGSVDELGGVASALSGLRSTHGTYFVTGNHEYYSGAEEWVEYLPSIGVRVLRNERIPLAGFGGVLDLAGVDDVTAADSGVPGHGANLSEALHGRDTDRPVVLLAHQPVQWPEAVRRGVDLQLSGHIHGGQLWPFTLAVPLQQPVVAGTARDGASQIYVSRGVGTWGPPVRVGAPPEISLIELRAPR